MPRKERKLKEGPPEIVIDEDGPRLFQAIVCRQGLNACKKGIRLNRMYTPTNCLRTATLFTGKEYAPRKSGELDRAIRDITQVIDCAKARFRPLPGGGFEAVQGTEQQPWADPMPETPMPDHP